MVYVDNDPLVLVQAQALLTSSAEGATDYLQADARDADLILSRAAQALDLSEPTAVMMLGILPFIGDPGAPVTRMDEFCALGRS